MNECLESFDLGNLTTRHTVTGAGLQIVSARTGNGLKGTLGGSTADNTWRSWPLAGALSYKGLHGLAIRYSSLPASTQDLFSVLDSAGTAQLTFAVTSTGAIAVFRGTSAGTLLGTSAAGFVSTSAYRMLEVDWNIRVGANGSFEIHSLPTSGGGSGLSYALTAIDTNPGLALTWTYTEHYLIDGLATIDDAYWNNGNGVTGGGFRGDVIIEAALGDADGSVGTWLPSTGATLFGVTDDNPPNLDTDYAYSRTPGTMDISMATIAGSGAVYGVQASCIARSLFSSELNSLRLSFRTGSSLTGATKLTTTGYASYVDYLTLDPGTFLPWTLAGVNAGFYGVHRPNV